MDSILTESRAIFGFKVEGEKEIDATILSNTIRDIAELTKLATKEENPDAYLKINVTAFHNGSFVIDFSTVCQAAANLLVNAAGLALIVVGVVKGILEIKKLLKGEKPKSIREKDDKIEIENNEGQKVTVNKSSGAVLNNIQIERLTINISNYVREHNPSGGFVFSTPDGDFVCNADELKGMSMSLPITEESMCKRFRLDVDLPIKKADLIGRSAWEFRYLGHNITARIDDDDWIYNVNNGGISFKAGDYLKASLEISVVLDSDGQLVSDSEKYNIIKVYGLYNEDTEQLKF